MSINIVDEFIRMKNKIISSNLKDIMGEKYEKEKCDHILEKYFEIRFFNENYKMDNTQSKEKIFKNINDYILRTLPEEYDDKIVTLIYLLDDNFDNIEEKGFKKILEKNQRTFNYFISELDCEDFYLDIKDTNIENVYDVGLNYSIKMPELYSEKAINGVFNKGVIAERKMLVEYILVLRNLLVGAIEYDFKTDYIVEFNSDVLEKKSKSEKILKMLNNKLAFDHISLKITYEDFLKYKDEISELINEGYQFSVVLNDDLILSREVKIYLRLFKYILVKKDTILMLNDFDNVVREV